jgi:hypothetical protein
MAKSKELESSKPAKPDYPPSRDTLDNAAVDRCIRAWNRAWNKALANGDSDYESRCAGNKEFLHAMPPLAGRENIRNFIACVTEALLLEVLCKSDATPLLYAAQVAISAGGREPNPPKSAAAPRPISAPKLAPESKPAAESEAA